MRPLRQGVTMIDIVVGVAIMLVLFLALFGLLQASLLLSTAAKAKSAATEVADTQMEYLRGLSYDNLGTVGGIPGGPVVANATTTVDGITYAMRTLIEYYDDPADGTGASDSNGVTTDYKVAKVVVTYSLGSTPYVVSLISSFAPPSIETTTGGGTLAIHVVNATGSDVEGASVHVVNASTSPTINFTTFSNASGLVYLGGAATSSQYQIAVSKSGYSSAQTYARDSQNANPTPGYLTVSKNQTTTSTFAIDLLSSLTLSTLSPATTTTFFDTFSDASNIATTTNAGVSGGSLSLTGGAASGDGLATAFAPAHLTRWGNMSATLETPASTTAAIQLYDSSQNLIPDAVLPGNSAGFTSFPVDLSALSTTTYPSLALGVTFSSSNSSAARVLDWTLSATTGPTPLTNVSFTLTGAKTVGSTSGGTPIYKTTLNSTTGGTGSVTLPLEWDSYSLAVSGYDISDACSVLPYNLSPGATVSDALYLVPSSSNSLFVSVTDNVGSPVPGASVQLTKTGFSEMVNSSSCGGAYFGSLSSGTYTIAISKTGYTTTTIPNVSISGETNYTASFP